MLYITAVTIVVAFLCIVFDPIVLYLLLKNLFFTSEVVFDKLFIRA